MKQQASVDTDDLRRYRTSQTSRESVGRWRHDLDADLQRLCLDVFGRELEEFGYECESIAVNTPAG